MRSTVPWSLPICLAVLTAGCTHPKFAYGVDPAFQSGRYATVAPDPRKDRILLREGMRPQNPDLHLQAVQAELAARKYRVVPAAEADLWVAVYVLTGGPAGTDSHRSGGGERPRRAEAGAERAGGSNTGFAIIVQLQDRKSGLTVWQGEANLDHRETGPDGRPLSIEATVNLLLRPLPARP